MAELKDFARRAAIQTGIADLLRAPPASIIGSLPAHLPPLPEGRRAVYNYYRLDFDDHGCPMRRMEDGRLVFHPILAPYLVGDFIRLYHETRDPACLDYARFVMDQAIRRAEPGRAELLFYYDPDARLSTMPHQFYSALTQCRYIKALAMLEKCVPGAYADLIRRAFASLSIPVEDGGVLLKSAAGWSIEEYPKDPPLFTLNGWLTALRAILSERRVLERVGIDYAELVRRNLDCAEKLMPLYDAKFCANSRYQLTGFTRLRIVTDRRVGIEAQEFTLMIPGLGNYPASLRPAENRWSNYLERREKALLQFNIVQSLASHPEPNRYTAKISVSAECNATVFVADGDFDPGLTAAPTTRWREIFTHRLAAGTNEISGPIPFDNCAIFAYPTNYKKKISGQFYNVYHIVHIMDLAVIYAMTGRASFADTARRWLSYMEQWPNLPWLADPSISKLALHYGKTLPEVIENYLAREPSGRWREIFTHRLAAGTNEISGPIPFDNCAIFAYPTNYKKKISGQFYNVYHIVHIMDLAVIYAMTGRASFADTARRWLSYMEQWPNLPWLADPSISKLALHYGKTLPEVIENYLAREPSGRF